MYKKTIILIIASFIMGAIIGSCSNPPYSQSTYTINNPIDGIYTLNCSVYEGFPDDSLYIDILHGDERIAQITKQYRDYNYPQNIVFLFEHDSNKFYYIEFEQTEYIISTRKSKYFDSKQTDFRIDPDYYNISNYKKLSELLNENTTTQIITDKFSSCNCDSKGILELMNYYKDSKESTT